MAAFFFFSPLPRNKFFLPTLPVAAAAAATTPFLGLTETGFAATALCGLATAGACLVVVAGLAAVVGLTVAVVDAGAAVLVTFLAAGAASLAAAGATLGAAVFLGASLLVPATVFAFPGAGASFLVGAVLVVAAAPFKSFFKAIPGAGATLLLAGPFTVEPPVVVFDASTAFFTFLATLVAEVLELSVVLALSTLPLETLVLLEELLDLSSFFVEPPALPLLVFVYKIKI